MREQGKESERGDRTDRKEKVVMEACLMYFAQKSRKSFRKMASSSLICWLYTISVPVKWLVPVRIRCNLDPDFMPHLFKASGCYFASSGDHGFERKELQKDPVLMHAMHPLPSCFSLPPNSTPPHHLNCSHNPQLVGDDNCRRPINYYCLHINYKHHVWQWGKWDLVTNFMRLGCPAAFLNMLQIAIPYLASVMGSYG